MRGKYIYPRQEINIIHKTIDKKMRANLPKDRTTADRAKTKAQAKSDFDAHEKRIKFRGLAHRFLEWRAEKIGSGI